MEFSEYSKAILALINKNICSSIMVYMFSVNRVKKQAKLSRRTLSEDEPK